jgi:hypothetical protein
MAQLNDNVLPFSKYAGDVGSGKPPGPPLLPPGGGDGMSELEPRVRAVEVHIDHIRADISDIKLDLKDIRGDLKRTGEKVEARFYLVLTLGVGATVLVLGVMAKGFKWY